MSVRKGNKKRLWENKTISKIQFGLMPIMSIMEPIFC